MTAADAAALTFGVIAIALTLIDVFQSVIVPRAASLRYRISFLVWRGLWRVWPWMAQRMHPRDPSARENFLATFAPFALIATLLLWVLVLILGYGAIFWALRAQITPPLKSYWVAAYFAGSSLLTIGYGDIVGRGAAARVLSLCAGASGLSVVATVTAYLFALFGTFQQRERFVATFAVRAGSPPSGIGFFEIAARTHTRTSLRDLMRDAQDWIATVMESHLAYPVLAYFRSSHDDQSWVGTLGALLDASLLSNTMLDHGEQGEARMCFAIGRHATRDLSHYLGLATNAEEGPGISREDFDHACERLAAAGYTLRDREAAWNEFALMRSEYAGRLNAMARFFHIPQAQWIGTRDGSHVDLPLV